MSRKLQLIAQTLLLVFLPAFVMRPVVVSVANGLQNSAVHSVQKSSFYQALDRSHINLRSVSRETSQIPTLTPCFEKTIRTLSAGRVLAFVAPAVSVSPQHFLILRI